MANNKIKQSFYETNTGYKYLNEVNVFYYKNSKRLHIIFKGIWFMNCTKELNNFDEFKQFVYEFLDLYNDELWNMVK